MSKFLSFSIIASFVGLWLKSFFNQELQIYVGFFLIFSFGILHGANDLLLINKAKSIENNISGTKILIYYLLVVSFGAFLFYFFPTIALASFILVSGYHFGQQHWQLEIKYYRVWLVFLFHLSYGLLILALLFMSHPLDVQRIISDICDLVILQSHLRIFLFCTIICTAVAGSFIFYNGTNLNKSLGVEFLLLLVLAILFKTSTLIWGFALYFIIWHSIPSMKDQIHFLYGPFTWQNCKRYFISAGIYWLLSLFGIGLLYFIFSKHYFFDALFFAFLAAITFPHVWVIVQMFKSKIMQEGSLRDENSDNFKS